MPDKRIEEISLFAWVGEDELGSGEMGIKQAKVPAGFIPIVSVSKDKAASVEKAMKAQSAIYGKEICLCEFSFKRVIQSTKE